MPILDNEAGGDLLSNILASSVEAESFIEDWNGDEIPSGFGCIQRAAMELRAAAAMGLVFTGLDENIAKAQE